MTSTTPTGSTPITGRHAKRAVIAAIAAAAIAGVCTACEDSFCYTAVVPELACGGVQEARDLGVLPTPPAPTRPPAGACSAATTTDHPPSGLLPRAVGPSEPVFHDA